MARNNVIDISSNESLPIQENNLIPTTLNTILSLSITPPNISQTTPSQPIKVSPLAPRALVFSTPPSSPIEPRPYLNSLDELLPRSTNPPSPPNQNINQTLPLPTPIDFESFFHQSTYQEEESAGPSFSKKASSVCKGTLMELSCSGLSTDNANITRKRSKPDKHGHENGKSAKEPEVF
ncbi:hypothetical protein Tco_1163456 [Tanacetum coccineum]